MIENDHGEASDCSGYRGVVSGATRRRKDEIIEDLEAEFKKINADLWGKGKLHRKPLTATEQLLFVWHRAWVQGMKDGHESERLETEFRKKHGLADDEPLPETTEIMRMVKKDLKSHT